MQHRRLQQQQLLQVVDFHLVVQNQLQQHQQQLHPQQHQQLVVYLVQKLIQLQHQLVAVFLEQRKRRPVSSFDLI